MKEIIEKLTTRGYKVSFFRPEIDCQIGVQVELQAWSLEKQGYVYTQTRCDFTDDVEKTLLEIEQEINKRKE